MDKQKQEVELISTLKKLRTSNVWEAVEALIQTRTERLTEDLIRAKPENVQRLQGAIQAFNTLLGDINSRATNQ